MLAVKPSELASVGMATKLVGGIAAEIHDGAGAEGHKHLGLVELCHHILDQHIFRAQALRGQHDLLIGLDVLSLGQRVDVAVVHHGAALVAKADRRHVLLKAAERVVLHDDHFGLQLMVAATAAFANVFGTVHDHKAYPLFPVFTPQPDGLRRHRQIFCASPALPRQAKCSAI